MQCTSRKIFCKILIIIPSIIIITTCQEEEVSLRDYPRLKTLEVSNINSRGAIFNAEIITKGNSDIIDHGFVWGESEEITIEYAEIISLGKINEVGKFSTEITTTLEKGKSYNVKAYLKTPDKIVYGQKVNFISLGSSAPQIEGFEPKNGDIGDTITIIGADFSRYLEKNIVKFGKYNSDIIFANRDTLKVIVPDFFDRPNPKISIASGGSSVTSDSSFLLNAQEIDSIVPLSGYCKSVVTIMGNNFIPDSTSVYFDSFQSEITSLNCSSIVCLFPCNLPPKFYEILVKIFDREVFFDKSILNLSPYIDDFNPKEGTFRDTILINGQNFSEGLAGIFVRFGTTISEIINCDSNNISVIVPDLLSEPTSTIKIIANLKEVTSNDHFKLSPPRILGFSPDSGTVGTHVDIQGENFNPRNDQNIVYFNNNRAKILNSTRTQLLVEAPDNLINQSTIKVEIAGQYALSDNAFNLIFPQIADFEPKVGSSVGSIVIYGNGFSPIRAKNIVKFNGTLNGEILYNSQNQIEVNLPFITTPEATIELIVDGNVAIADNKYLLKWYKYDEFPFYHYGAIHSFKINDIIYFGLGQFNKEFYSYNIESKELIRLNDIPFRERDFAVAFNIGEHGFFGLGRILEPVKDRPCYNDFWEYNPQSDSWIQKADFPDTTQAGHACFVVNDKAYLGTGMRGDGSYFKNLWEYNPESDTWTEKSSFPGLPRWGAVAFSINGFGYMGLGSTWSSHGTTYFKDMYKYNTFTDTWSQIPDISNYGRAFSSYFILEDYVYVLGGDGGKSDVFRFNPLSEIWDKMEDSGIPITNFNPTYEYNGKGYVLFVEDLVFVYDPNRSSE